MTHMTHMTHTLSIGLIALATAAPALAAHDVQTIELKDGTRLVIQSDNRMRHVDQRGRVVLMREGEEMEARDGAKYMMKNNAIWRQLLEKGTLNPK